jgi:hypothetical protein
MLSEFNGEPVNGKVVINININSHGLGMRSKKKKGRGVAFDK